MRFSIIIPTRNRPEYLPGTVRSALTQTDASDLEVIVFDNCSGEPASQSLRDISDKNLTIVRSDTALAMRDSWERAVSLATGDFVTVLGDDDALVPNAVLMSKRLIQKHDIKILRWDRAQYFWPQAINRNLENVCTLPLGKALFKMDGHWLLRRMGKMALPYSAAPTIYNSWVNRELIDEVKRRTGRLFHSSCPDVDSGFAFAYIGRFFFNLNFPLSICGQSPKSNGSQVINEYIGAGEGKSLSIAADFHELNEKASILYDDNAVQTVLGGIANSYTIMARTLGVPLGVFSLKKSALILQVLREEFPTMSQEVRDRYLAYLETLFKRHPISLRRPKKYLKSLLHDGKSSGCKESNSNRRPENGYDEYARHLVLDCMTLGVSNAGDLAKLVDVLLGLGDRFDRVVVDWYPKSRTQHLRDLLYGIFRSKHLSLRDTKYRPGL